MPVKIGFQTNKLSGVSFALGRQEHRQLFPFLLQRGEFLHLPVENVFEFGKLCGLLHALGLQIPKRLFGKSPLRPGAPA